MSLSRTIQAASLSGLALCIAVAAPAASAQSGSHHRTHAAAKKKKKKTSSRGPRGLTGPRGPAGPTGPTGAQGAQGGQGGQGGQGQPGVNGAPATKLWADVHITGNGQSTPLLTNFSGAVGVTQTNTGFTQVNFNQSVANCAVQATLSDNNPSRTVVSAIPQPGTISAVTLPSAPSLVLLRTTNSSGTDFAEDFDVAVFC